MTPTVVVTPTATPTIMVTPTAPSTEPEISVGETYLLRNKLYSAGEVSAVACRLPRALLSSKKALLGYANAFVGCLNRAWKPLADRSDFAFVPPVVHAAPAGTLSPCGPIEADIGALYCDNDLGIYFDWPLYVAKESNRQSASRDAVEFTMAHEFGHHLQQLSGMSSGYHDRYWAATGAAKLQETQRHELQASCFAAAFFGANQKTLRVYGGRLEQYGYDAFTGGGDAPLKDNGLEWSRRAFKAKGPAACNTWVAAPAMIS